jgi:hypothetical protein
MKNPARTFVILSRPVLFKIRAVSDSSSTENQLFFQKSYYFRDNVQKYGTSKEATDENMAHAS